MCTGQLYPYIRKKFSGGFLACDFLVFHFTLVPLLFGLEFIILLISITYPVIFILLESFMVVGSFLDINDQFVNIRAGVLIMPCLIHFVCFQIFVQNILIILYHSFFLLKLLS